MKSRPIEIRFASVPLHRDKKRANEIDRISRTTLGSSILWIDPGNCSGSYMVFASLGVRSACKKSFSCRHDIVCLVSK